MPTATATKMLSNVQAKGQQDSDDGENNSEDESDVTKEIRSDHL